MIAFLRRCYTCGRTKMRSDPSSEQKYGATRAGEQKYGHREIHSCIEDIQLSSITIFMFVFTFDLLCDIITLDNKK